MEVVDVAIVGGGPAGSTCAAFCAAAGLRTLVLEREKFPREKVCGDCLNPACWPVLARLELAEEIRNGPHGVVNAVEFIAISGQKLRVDLFVRDDDMISVKRSLFDHLLLDRARTLGAEIREEATLIALDRRATNDFVTAGVGRTGIQAPGRSDVADDHPADTRASFSRARKFVLHWRCGAGGRTIYRRRNLLRGALR